MQKVPLVLVLLCYGLCTTTHADAQWQWARAARYTGNPGYGGDVSMIATDNSNNVYLSGISAIDTTHFGAFSFYNIPLSGQQTITVKYDASGNVLWADAALSGDSFPFDITADNSGNVYVFGIFDGDSVRFGSHLITESNVPGVNGYFIVKYNSSGRIVWVRSLGDKHLYYSDFYGGSITADSRGNIYIAGSFKDSIVSIGRYQLTNANLTSLPNIYADIFVAKYDSSGNVLWAKKYGGAYSDEVARIKAGADDKIYLTGYSNSPSIMFGATRLTNNMFLTEMDTSGNIIWARDQGGGVVPYYAAVDKTHNIYVSGTIEGASPEVVFGADTFRNAYNSSFLFKYDSSGRPVWGKVIGSSTPPSLIYSIQDITVDVCNNVWVSGGVTGGLPCDVKFDATTIAPYSPGNLDPKFFAAFDTNGKLLTHLVYKYGGDNLSPISADNLGNVYLGGDFANDTLVLGNNSLYMPDWAEGNIFLAKYKTPDTCTAIKSN